MMNSQLQSRQRSVLRSISAAASALLVIVGSMVVAGWIFDIPALKSVSPDWVSMKANTAVCFVLTGLSLWCLRDEQASQRVRRLGHACAALVTLVALLTLGEHLLAVDFGIDQLLMQQPAATADPGMPGRMSSSTAFAFLLTALALLGLDWKNRQGYRPVLAFALVTAVIGLLALVGYIYGVKSLHAFSPFSSVAVHTAALLIVASVGILWARPDRGPLGILTVEGIGSTMVRRILPLAIILPFAIGWLRMRGEQEGFYGFEFGLALFATSNAIMFAALIWITGVSLNRGDADRKRSEDSLREERARLAGLIGSAMDAVITVDSAQRITLFNPAAEKMFGFTAEQLIGQPIERLIPERHRAGHSDHIRNFGQTGVSNRQMGALGAVSGVRADGEEFPLEAAISQIEVNGQKVYTAILRDITERKRAEEGLLRFRMAMETTLDGIFLLDFETFRYLDVNETACRMLGYSREELLTMRTMDTNLSLTEADQRRRFEEARALGSDHVMTESEGRFMRRKDGTVFPIEAARRYLRVGDEEIVVGIARDITERMRAEEALRESEEKYRQMVDLSPDAVTIHQEGRWVFANPAAARILGVEEPSQLVGRSLLDFMRPDIHQQVKARWKQLYEDKQPVDMAELSMVRPDGTIVYLETSAIPVVWKGRPAAQGVARDITERKRAEEALRERAQIATLGADVGAALTRGETLREMLQLCCEAIVQHLHAAFARIWMLNEADNILELQASAGMYTHLDGAHGRVPVGKFKIGLIAQERKPHLTNQVVGDPRVGDQEWAKREGMVAFAGYPLLVEDHLVGVVAMFARNTLADVTLQGLASIANNIALGIERKQAEARIRESEAKYRQLIEQAPDGIFLSDTKGNYLLVNSRGCELLGYAEHEIVGMNAKKTYLEEERGIHTERLEQIRAGQTLRFERMVKRKDGSTFPAEISLKMLDTGTLQAIFHDITERRNQEQKIARLSRIQAVLSGINSAIVRIRDRQELFEEACRIAVEHGGFSMAWIAMLDHASGTLVPVAQAGLPMDFGAAGDSSNRPVGLVPGGPAEVALREKRPAFDNDIGRGLGEMESELGPDTLRLRRAAVRLGAKSVIVLPLFVEGQTFGILTLYAPERNFFDDEEIKLLTELAGDISFGLEFIAKEEKVDYLAYYDALTGLPNRSLFFDRLTHQIGTAAREHSNVALVLMDLDRFRLINDTLGRQAGDTLMGVVAHRIKETFRDQDTVARVGADSFAVAVSGTWRVPDAAHFLEAHNRKMFGQPFVLGQEELRVSATAGIAVFPDDGNNPEMLFANAEAALRKAKEQNARFLFYSPEMNARVADSLRLENRLRQALENGEMVLWYQPKVNVKTRKLTGFEALMRWQDPETGMVPPAKFIPLMEQTGLILEAGRWALLQVARDCRLWVTNGIKPPRVAVNVSPIQLRQKDFVATVVEAAEKAEEAGALLDLEITESVIMENVEAMIPKLQTIREIGVEISIDDFGTGYSSLAYIARLPIYALKIDRSFVDGMTNNQDSLAIVRSVISLAHSLRLHVIAEGVETEDQAALLHQLECDEMQGYLFSRPVPPDEVLALVKKLS